MPNLDEMANMRNFHVLQYSVLTSMSFSAAVGDPARDSLTGGSSPLEDEDRLDTGGESCCLETMQSNV